MSMLFLMKFKAQSFAHLAYFREFKHMLELALILIYAIILSLAILPFIY
jgi:hypothetical protein